MMETSSYHPPFPITSPECVIESGFHESHINTRSPSHTPRHCHCHCHCRELCGKGLAILLLSCFPAPPFNHPPTPNSSSTTATTTPSSTSIGPFPMMVYPPLPLRTGTSTIHRRRHHPYHPPRSVASRNIFSDSPAPNFRRGGSRLRDPGSPEVTCLGKVKVNLKQLPEDGHARKGKDKIMAREEGNKTETEAEAEVPAVLVGSSSLLNFDCSGGRPFTWMKALRAHRRSSSASDKDDVFEVNLSRFHDDLHDGGDGVGTSSLAQNRSSSRARHNKAKARVTDTEHEGVGSGSGSSSGGPVDAWDATEGAKTWASDGDHVDAPPPNAFLLTRQRPPPKTCELGPINFARGRHHFGSGLYASKQCDSLGANVDDDATQQHGATHSVVIAHGATEQCDENVIPWPQQEDAPISIYSLFQIPKGSSFKMNTTDLGTDAEDDEFHDAYDVELGCTDATNTELGHINALSNAKTDNYDVEGELGHNDATHIAAGKRNARNIVEIIDCIDVVDQGELALHNDVADMAERVDVNATTNVASDHNEVIKMAFDHTEENLTIHEQSPKASLWKRRDFGQLPPLSIQHLPGFKLMKPFTW